ncbi:hypothetical protein PsYK624_070620 [Phanerochaete sordida]|uniref:Uncharacterized protein n=1 Tax=Phanerochaete sordida TaxID=48140 RepID=A0A9P3G9X6_9APHY|nr:hypothetical protein PsYK624_070620 [Phanerochaete sordida]
MLMARPSCGAPGSATEAAPRARTEPSAARRAKHARCQQRPGSTPGSVPATGVGGAAQKSKPGVGRPARAACHARPRASENRSAACDRSASGVLRRREGARRAGSRAVRDHLASSTRAAEGAIPEALRDRSPMGVRHTCTLQRAPAAAPMRRHGAAQRGRCLHPKAWLKEPSP